MKNKIKKIIKEHLGALVCKIPTNAVVKDILVLFKEQEDIILDLKNENDLLEEEINNSNNEIIYNQDDF